MAIIDLVRRLLPSIPEIDELLHTVREKYNIPPVLPENQQLAELLMSSDYYDWAMIQTELEAGLRSKFQLADLGLDKYVQQFISVLNSSPQIKGFLITEDVGVSEPTAEKFIQALNKEISSALGLLDKFYQAGSQKLLDHLITGRPVEVPSEWFNIILTGSLPPDGEKFVIAIAHLASDPDEISEKFRDKIVETFGEMPKFTEEALETAEYLAKKNTGDEIGKTIDLYLERHPGAIPYKKGTGKYDDALRRLKDTLRQRMYRLQQDVNQMATRDKN